MTTPWQLSDGLLVDPVTVTAPAFTTDQVVDAVAVASATIAGFTGRSFAPADRVDYLETSATGVQLPGYPVTAITSVEASLDGVSWTVLDRSLWRPHSDRGWIDMQLGPSNVVAGPGTWAAWPLLPEYAVQLRITYSCGYATLPADLAAVVKHLAAAYLLNPFAETEIKVGELTDKFDPKLLGVAAPWALAVLGRYADVGVA